MKMSFKKKVVIINVLSEMAINQNISIKVMCISVSRDTNDNYHKGREGGVQRVMTEIILSEEMIMVEHPLSYIFDILVVSRKKNVILLLNIYYHIQYQFCTPQNDISICYSFQTGED